MERIGIAASKIARGSLLRYNFFVVLIAFLCSVLLFLVCGFSIMAALFVLSVICRPFLPPEFHTAWFTIVRVCLVALGIVVGVFDILAILKNVKITKTKI